MVKEQPDPDQHQGFERVIERIVDFDGTPIPCIGGGSTDQELQESSEKLEQLIRNYME